MKSRGMIFNAEMVRAILDGSKTQTRRIMKPQPEVCPRGGHWWSSNVFKTMLHVEEEMQNGKGGWGGLAGDACPFGTVGDRIWVRETWAMLGNEDRCPIDWNENVVKDNGPDAARIYRASCTQGDYGLWQIPDDADWKPNTDSMQYDGAWTPSIHMPRWASRITLEITDVRVERLNSISDTDANAEGVSADQLSPARYVFGSLWQSIYGADNPQSWQANPWVWVIEFRRVEGGEA